MRDTDQYILNIDSPTHKKQASRQIELQGWLIVKKQGATPKLRLLQGDLETPVKFGVWRHDVAVAFSQYDPAVTEYCGFEEEFEVSAETVSLQLDVGKGFETIHSFEFEITSPYRQYNPYLSENWQEHNNLLETKKFYNKSPRLYDAPSKDAKHKAIAFYLPQFHPIEQNDIAWGKGFTEWTNVAAGQPRFAGHHQPLLPGELGFYDLRLEENIKAQIDMAKNHDIYGFCMYYYWFSGKKVLDMPLDTILRHKEWDFNFMICWANENWTKRWDGREKDVILEQKYRDEDPLEFIKEVEHILLDPRYIRVNGKPILSVYRCEHLDDAKRYAKVWRDYFKKTHGLELELVSVMSFYGEDPQTYGFDAGLDFSPSNILRSSDEKLKVSVPVDKKLIDPFYDGIVFDYRAAVKELLVTDKPQTTRIYDCVIPSWDNDARKKGHGSYVFQNEDPTLYKKWLSHCFARTTDDTPFVFINAWNEWAEGTVLEPTNLYGYAYLNKTKEAITEQAVSVTAPSVVAALLFIDTKTLWEDMKKAIGVLQEVDASISIAVSSEDLQFVDEIRAFAPTATVWSVPERGGDVLPFVEQIKAIDYVGTSTVVKLAFVENRESPMSLVKNAKSLQRHIAKATESKQLIALGGTTALGHRLSFVAPAATVHDMLDLDILPEDFTVKTEKEFAGGVVESIPEPLAATLSNGLVPGSLLRSYKQFDIR